MLKFGIHLLILKFFYYLIHIEYMYIYMQYNTNKNSLEKTDQEFYFSDISDH